MPADGAQKLISQNRKALHHYQLDEFLEAGMILEGTEIKALRTKGCQLMEAFVRISDKGEAFLHQMEIPLYVHGNTFNHEPMRRRKLLLHRREIQKLRVALEARHLSCVPLKVYLKNGLAKVQLGIGKPKKHYDKRENLKSKDTRREIERTVKSHNSKDRR